MTANMSVAVLCSGLLGLLLFGLGFAVSITRARSQTLIDFESDPNNTLHKVVRAHGNTAEYAPMLVALMLYLATTNPGLWIVGTMIIVTLARYVIVAGLLTGSLDKANPLRFLGALVTYVGGALLALAAILTAL